MLKREHPLADEVRFLSYDISNTEFEVIMMTVERRPVDALSHAFNSANKVQLPFLIDWATRP